MKILDKINFKQPKYMLPAIIYLPLLGTAYFVFDMFNTELADVTPTELETTEYLNDKMPTAQISEELGDKYENMLKSYGKIEDYSAVENIEPDDGSEANEDYDSKYTIDDQTFAIGEKPFAFRFCPADEGIFPEQMMMRSRVSLR